MGISGPSPPASRIDNESFRALRDVLGSDVCDMDLVHALHLSRNDLQMAAHIVLETPGFRNRKKQGAVSSTNSAKARSPSVGKSSMTGSSTVTTNSAAKPSSGSPRTPAKAEAGRTTMSAEVSTDSGTGNLDDSGVENGGNEVDSEANDGKVGGGTKKRKAEGAKNAEVKETDAKAVESSGEAARGDGESVSSALAGLSIGDCPLDSRKLAIKLDTVDAGCDSVRAEASDFSVKIEARCDVDGSVKMETGFDSAKVEASNGSVKMESGLDSAKVEAPNGSVKMESGLDSVKVEAPNVSLKMEPGSVKVETPEDGKAAYSSGAKVAPLTSPLASCTEKHSVVLDAERWWLLEETEVAGYSTSRGSRIGAGDFVSFNFPKPVAESKKKSFEHKKPWARQKASSDIVRFSTKTSGEIGRLPADWAKCLIPLVRSNKINILGRCKMAPEALSLMSSIVLDLRVYINKSLFVKYKRTVSIEETTFRPLPSLMELLKMTPLRKAQFTPEDLNVYTCRRPEEGPPSKRSKVEQKDTEDMPDSEVDHVVGTSDSRELKEMEEPEGLECKLRPYQKQALFWMSQLEDGVTQGDAAKALHPCWSEYRIADRRASSFYVNSFSGEATLDFPSALQASRGGILADAMGLGKTVMTISLLLCNRRKGCNTSQVQPTVGKTKSFKSSSVPKEGGTLIICPMTLLSQWRSELETHVSSGTFSVYAYYGPDRSRDSKTLSKYDVVLTTYGVVQSECNNSGDDGPIHNVNWFRVVLDEAHSIKANKSRVAQAVFKLVADRRLCLTGTPVQNKLEDMYSLFHFLRVEPWCNWGWWYKLIQKPYEEGDERGLKLLQAILKPLMLRRTKDSTDKEGRPILVLPPAQCEVIECNLSESERDFYDALYHRSKVKFDQFVQEGKVLHNYASILELLLRLRQACDHPFLVLSRGDTEDYADLGKLARRFLDKNSSQVPSTAYVKEVVDDIRKGDTAECPICLEMPEDAVLTPCAHQMCRECLFNSWRTSAGGPCPICRRSCTKQELITVPTSNRFRVNVEEQWKESSKVEALLQQLETLRESKSVVFSQWTAFLDLLEIPLKRKNFRFVRLDGTLSQHKREQVLKDFSNIPDVAVMLISLKAGGVGLNLTAASNAFLMDPWWNPAVEEQAIMRIHRIGQTQNVSIKRFIVKDSVEERMQQVQARKQRLIAGALTDEEVRSARIEELKMLFR
ncbi:DNA repair protein RAD5A isoform X2 [Selaginella moellendorffii]|uniref:DNA repair protein RAD5A isoform X2 n=1 Tax=Selaginella moellendorffii TaxID=88036 RepID=UPI000D1CB28E|nr:DNA repair protein RAD5A isoform X2 [Selaginella moellendorffii]|eukprot:XP_024534461.1 DNA repair protein RAD5A isoform X2 [Selaginella moellendorffii]